MSKTFSVGTRSLRTQLALYFLPLAILPAIGISYYATQTYEASSLDTLTRRAQSEKDAIIAEIDSNENKLLDLARTHAKSSQLKQALQNRDATELVNLSSNFKTGMRVRFYDASGNYIVKKVAQVEDPQVPYISREGLKRLRNSRETLDRYFSSNSNTLVTVVRILIIDKDRIYGILEEESDFGPNQFSELKVKRGCELLFLDRNFNSIAGTLAISSGEMKKHSKEIFRSPEEGIWSGSKEPTFLHLGEGRYAGFLYDMPAHFGKIKHWGYLAVFVSMTAVDATTSKLKVNLIYITSSLVLGFAFLIFLFSNRVVRPLEVLVLAMKRIKTGRVEEIPSIDSAYEIEYLVRAFNDMSRNIVSTKGALERKVEELKFANQEIRSTQSQLVQSAKMISLGQIVAGVAHELNNPIGFIYSNMQSMKTYVEKIRSLVEEYHRIWDSLPESERTKLRDIEKELDIDFLLKDMEDITRSCVDGAKRTKEIVLGLRSFSRMDSSNFKTSDVHEGIRSTLKLLVAEFKNRIQIHEEFGAIPEVECNLSQLNQVFMNLFSNAASAITGRGDIWIRTLQVDAGIRIEIEDNGSGITKENMSKIFDPFFTTKKVGQGTGLGLSIAYGIIDKHQGKIWVENSLSSVDGKGARFVIELPIRQMAKVG